MFSTHRNWQTVNINFDVILSIHVFMLKNSHNFARCYYWKVFIRHNLVTVITLNNLKSKPTIKETIYIYKVMKHPKL